MTVPSSIHTRIAAALLALLAAAHAPSASADLRLSTALGQPSGLAPQTETPVAELKLADSLRDSLIDRALDAGTAMIGTRYELGADRNDAVDCSALVRRMFVRAGVRLPRTTEQQLAIGTAVPRGRLHRGDLLFYRFSRHGLHVAVYVARGVVLHASSNSRRVVFARLDEVWDRRFVGARRII